jgi:hypothetical protein
MPVTVTPPGGLLLPDILAGSGGTALVKRGMRGIYQFCSHKHLHRYVAEFDFRYTHRIANGVNDAMRADNLLVVNEGINGEQRCVDANLAVARDVRQTIIDQSG